MAMLTALTLSKLPSELVASVAGDAARDADRVGVFLDAFGIQATPECPLQLPVAFLLDLGAALRLLAWEQQGLQVHREAGLPPARGALADVLRQAANACGSSSPAPNHGLAYRVLMLSVDRLAWSARSELDIDVALDEADEDAILAGLADFLWEHRPR
jgi:hypothetical protein